MSKKVLTPDVKMAQANDVITDDELTQEIAAQNAYNDEKAIEQARQTVEDLKAKLADAKLVLAKLTKSGNSSAPKGFGVISTILSLVTDAPKTGISKADILAKLVEMFPDRSKEGMEKTINVQLPGRMSKERGIKIEKLESGNFHVVK